MEISRRDLLRASGAAAAVACCPVPTLAADYPRRLIRWIVPFPTGGAGDMVARLIATSMSATLRQPIIIDNRGGASQVIGLRALASAEPDGYTIGTGSSAALIYNPLLNHEIGYEVKKDFVPISLTVRFALVLVAKRDFAPNSAKELFDLAKTEPGIAYATQGAGSPNHLIMELLQKQLKVQLSHVPYKGAALALQDVLGGHVPLSIQDIAGVLPLMASGRIKILGAFTRTRIPQLPDVPTLEEQGIPNAEIYPWQGLIAPRGASKEVLSVLSRAVGIAMADPQVRRTLLDNGMEPVSSTPEEYAAIIESESAKWRPVIQALGLSMR